MSVPASVSRSWSSNKVNFIARNFKLISQRAEQKELQRSASHHCLIGFQISTQVSPASDYALIRTENEKWPQKQVTLEIISLCHVTQIYII